MHAAARRNLGKVIALIAVAAALVWAARGTEFSVAELARGRANAAQYVRGMFPPDWSVLPKALKALVVTIQMAIMGTFLGFVAALPISFLAARTTALPRVFTTSVK